MIYIHLDNFKTAKHDEGMLLFSVYLQFDDQGAIAIPGWRFKEQHLSPPASKVGSTWFPSVYATEEIGDLIYNELRKVDLTKYPLVDPPIAKGSQVRSLFNEQVQERLFPNIKKAVTKGI